MGRNNTKIIELMGRKFEIRKFDAYTGGYIIYQLFEKFLPMGMETKINPQMNNILPQGRTAMSKAEFTAFMQDCLSAVGEVLPARTAPIINANGTWGIQDIRNNTMLVILLVINVLTYNAADFFTAESLKELKQAMQGISPVNLKI